MVYYPEHLKPHGVPQKCGFPCSTCCPMRVHSFYEASTTKLSIPPTSRWRLRAEPSGIPYQIPETYAVPGWLLAQTLSEKKLAYATHVEKMKKLLENKIEPRIEKATVIIEDKRKVTWY